MLLADHDKIHLALGLHNHQPIGNWDHVIEDAYQHSYLPFIDVLERHPAIKLTIHYDGHLLSWLAERHPEFLKRLRALVARQQLELVSGGYYEPMLPIIPDDDKVGQIRRLTEAVRQLTGYEPVGMSLAGRVWEPHLARPLAEAGIQYAVLDDQPFQAVGLSGTELFGYYQTEEQGEAVALFPIARDLRALIPFQPPEKVIDYLRQQASPDGARLALFFDDGAKFGGWPNTYQAVYVEGWLEHFFQLLETNQDWITTCTIDGYRQKYRPWGRIYLPAASYPEMQEWALPPDQTTALQEARGQVEPRFAEFLRGGYWRHFLVKYPEANNLHKKMLRVANQVRLAGLAVADAPNGAATSTNKVGEAGVSAAFGPPGGPGGRVPPTGAAAKLAESARRLIGHLHGTKAPLPAGVSSDPASLVALARDALWRGQSNDPYWHGVFGGIYLNHLRGANYSALLQAEAICDRLRNGQTDFCDVEITDFDRDGAVEALVSTRAQNLYFAPTYGGALFEHDLKLVGHNLLDTLARRPEAYHSRIGQASPVRDLTNAPPVGLGERAVYKEGGLERLLHYDWYRRVSLLDHFLHPDTRLETIQNMSYGEQGDFINQPYELETAETPDGVSLTLRRDGHVWVGQDFWPVRVEKQVRIPRAGGGYTVDYTVTNMWDRPVQLWFGVEFNVNLRSGSGPGRGYYSAAGRHLEPAHPGALAEDEHIAEIGARDDALGVDIHLAWDFAGTLWRFPIETVSRSEGGFERVYQSSVLVPNWRISLPESGKWLCRLTFATTQQVTEP